MSKRIYWLLPDVASARRTMDDMLLARIDERHMHFVGREDINLSGLHVANVLQTSDVVRAAQWGALIGAVLGSAAGLVVAWYLPAAGEPPQGGLVVVLAMVGAIFGTWASSMIGVSIPSQRLRRFERAIQQGQILLMLDVPPGRVEAIESRLQALHPEARLEGIEPNIPAFP
ncbi:MAG: DUF1269 domain-containing protein [Burkholderiales bacterium RIFCSPHIGHO2_12_FULL_67_38]|nr:MAG: DUF1269 domain-containing protein [Burkholderiales bacterium RIFCSPLOWO2_02_FULL_67_64]OGB37377.1 MAG: DUF1269 domain-containing protein [Burkholderiales bacterium RIFCSPHIGHO2_12_FULL_67_38]